MKNLFLVALIFSACSEYSSPSQASSVTAQSTKASIEVHGMVCGGCEGTIKTTLSALPGVQSVDASHKKKRVDVAFDSTKITLDRIKSEISGLGYEVK